MNRRDFLLFRTEAARRVVELSCRLLYLRTLELDATSARPAGSADADDPTAGEPPAVFASPSLEQIFRDIDRDLARGELLRVVDRSWLPPGELERHVERLVAAHRARGGLVEIRAD